MNNITDIVEKLKLNASSKVLDRKERYQFFPKDKEELKNILKDLFKERGYNANLNDIDTSEITDMSRLFYYDFEKIENIDISEWEVQNVIDMSFMFKDCKYFNCNLSKWNPRNLKTAEEMFFNCLSFNSPIFSNTKELEDARGMFRACEQFNQDVSGLYTENLKIAEAMFMGCKKFNQDISNWKLPKLNNMNWMFSCCTHFNKDLSKLKINKSVKKIGVFLKCINLDVIPLWYKQPIK